MDCGKGGLAREELVISVRAAIGVAVGIAELVRQATEVASVIAQVIRGVGASGAARHQGFRAVDRF